jgi:hypothetical protein
MGFLSHQHAFLKIPSKIFGGPGMMTHTCNHNSSRRTEVRGQPGQNVETLFQSISQAWWFLPDIPRIREEDQVLRLAKANLKNNYSEKDQGHGSSGRAPAWQSKKPKALSSNRSIFTLPLQKIFGCRDRVLESAFCTDNNKSFNGI